MGQENENTQRSRNNYVRRFRLLLRKRMCEREREREREKERGGFDS